MKMWAKLEINWTVLLTIPYVVAIRGGGLCFCTPGFQRGTFPRAAQNPRLSEEGWQTWSRAQGSQDSPSTGYTQHLHYFLTPLIILMHWGNKSLQTEAAGSFWEQCRTLLVSSHATALSISAAPPPRDNSHRQEISGCFSFTGEKAALQLRWLPQSILRCCSSSPVFTPRTVQALPSLPD